MLIHERQEKQTNDDPLQIEKTDDES